MSAKPSPDSGVARNELFITIKRWNADHGYERALKAFDASLDKLGIDTGEMATLWNLSPAGRIGPDPEKFDVS